MKTVLIQLPSGQIIPFFVNDTWEVTLAPNLSFRTDVAVVRCQCSNLGIFTPVSICVGVNLGTSVLCIEKGYTTPKVTIVGAPSISANGVEVSEKVITVR